MRKIFISTDGRLRSGWALLLFLAALAAASAALGGVVWLLYRGGLRMDGGVLGNPALIPSSVARLLATLAATWAGCAAVRQLAIDAGLADKRWLSRLGVGAAIGAVAISASVGLAWALGFEHLAGPINSAGKLVGAAFVQLAVIAPASAAEEIGLRGFVFQQLARGMGGLLRAARPSTDAGAAERFGTVMAIVITGVFFGLAHARNPNISDEAVLNIILVGVWFGVLVARTRSLWLPIGLHISWNWCQGFVWGEPISGIPTGTSLMQRWASGDTRWTGGAFGPEASLFTAFVLVAMLLVTLVWRPSARQAPAADT